MRKSLVMLLLGASLIATSCSRQQLSYDLGNGVNITYRKVPTGRILLDGPKVKSFYMQETETTIGQYTAQLKEEKREMASSRQTAFNERGNSYPLRAITPNEATNYCRWLSERIGKKVRLPTQQEWEIATYRDLPLDKSKAADKFQEILTKGNLENKWYGRVSRAKDIFPVGFQTNELGICDLVGNVGEIVISGERFRSYGKDHESERTEPPEGKFMEPDSYLEETGFRTVIED